MDISDPLERTRRDYDNAASAYDDLVRHDETSTKTLSTAMITAFADLVRARHPEAEVMDVGCGPGQWTELLVDLGVRAYGVDLSPGMIAIARSHRPEIRYEVGSILDIDADDGSVAGILAHFSLIHLPPDLLPAAFSEFARVLEPGAPLLIGMHITDTAPTDRGWLEYDHKASPSYVWTLDALAELLREKAFDEIARLRIEPLIEGRPPPGYLLAHYRTSSNQ